MPHFLDQENNLFESIGFDIENEGDNVHLHFHLHQELHEIKGLPKKTYTLNPPDVTRGMELWKETCFEVFIRPLNNSSEYFEVNFSPEKRKWNAFYFSSYRSPIQETEEVEFIQSTLTTSTVTLSFTPPSADCSYHPKIILFHPKDQRFTYLSDFQHPKSGPDFHIFPVT